MLFLLLACTPTPEASDTPALLTCPELLTGGDVALDEAALQRQIDAVRHNLFPELEGIPLRLNPNMSETSFFSANLEIATIDNPPNERQYLVHYSTLQFDEPPPANAVTAILVHELKHVRDYTEMSSEELVDFAVRYATEPISAYERQTDEHALQLGCGEGLIEFREWLYGQVTPEVEAQKRIDYYTPDEIRTWMAAQ